MFGEDRLGQLPSSQAQERSDGRWVLSTTADPLDWTFERWSPEEAAVIQVLGAEHFSTRRAGGFPP